jgi:hypothetical protein
MSGGGSTERTEASAVPASTLLGIAEAGEVAAHSAARASSDEAEFQAFSRRAEYHFAARDDEIGGLSGPPREGERFDEPGPGAADRAVDEALADIRPVSAFLEAHPEPVTGEGFAGGGGFVHGEGFAHDEATSGSGEHEPPAPDADRADLGLDHDAVLPAAEPGDDAAPAGAGAVEFDVGDGPAQADGLVAEAAGDLTWGSVGAAADEDSGAGPAAADPPGEAVFDGHDDHEPVEAGGSAPKDPPHDSVDSLSSDAPGDDLSSEASDGTPEPQPGDAQVRGPMRPLGPAPLLDSKPLPATMPGMLRPRPIEDFTLPAQRPAFEVGPEQPADLG